VDRIASAVLYEGYILYPYRPALKNRQRWTFGGVFPQSYSETHPGTDASSIETQCLVQGDDRLTLEVQIRFLHLTERRVGRLVHPVAKLPEDGLPEYELVESLELGGELYQAWQEAEEREVNGSPLPKGEGNRRIAAKDFTFPASRRVEPLRAADGRIAAVLIREQEAIHGSVEVAIEPLEDRLFRVMVTIFNRSPLGGEKEGRPHLPERPEGCAAQMGTVPFFPAENADRAARDEALRRSLVSTHTILGVSQGEFISLMDPPDRFRAAAENCRNVGTWPVLVGDPDRRDTMLSSPIILYDYPQIAAESPGDLFDGTEIDEMLTLRILTLTNDEKRAMAAVDPRARALLQRTEGMTGDQLLGLHGAVRKVAATLRVPAPLRIDEEESVAFRSAKGNPFRGAKGDNPTAIDLPVLSDRRRLECVHVGPAELGPGDRVRLRPRSRADIFDIALAGMTATIESIEQDYEERIYLAVTVDDDPGRDLGAERQPGHRFFFSLDEVEPVAQAEPGSRSP
jgi:hypothetical protein